MANEAKEAIKKLIEKYGRIKNSGKLKSYTEEDTKNSFIIPLFETLGWDFSDKDEVSAEESMSAGRVDFGFYLNGRIKFYLETKKLSVDSYKEDFANQTINYSWNKGTTWAVLTNFESLKVFNAQDIDKKLSDKLLFEIPYDKYIGRFDQLFLLSKEAFKDDLIDKYAEEHGKKLQKVPVSSVLYKDLQLCRDILTEAFGLWNEKVDKDLLDEGIQKLLDRLIFIRVCEDRKIEPQTLIPMLREYRVSGSWKDLYSAMIKKFREFDARYNSDLFEPHNFETWEDHNGSISKVINILRGKESYYEYDFKAMPADVLGTVYENYLSYRLQKSKKGVTVAKDAEKRKEQGIYYTPNFIVDYIVKNALGPILEKCKTIEDLKKIKVLDPACGSGSFLVKALEMINKKYIDFGAPDNELMKLRILTENIYGVDLDEKAVDICRLNLLVSILGERRELPLLNENIKKGNSLISGTDKELEKYFGKNFRDKRPFNWKEEFPEAFKQGGFDVIMGNPPYIKEDVNRNAFDGLHNNPYYQGKMDIWTMFGCIAIDLLKKGGILSFIAPSSWISNNGASIFRNKILREGELINYIDFGDYKIFENASIQTMIFGYQKGKPKTSYGMSYLKIDNKDIFQDDLVNILLSQKSKKLVKISPVELYDKTISFSEAGSKAILDKIENKSNYHFKKEEIGNGIDVLQDFVKKDYIDILKDESVKKGDGIFILSKQEVEKLVLNEKERSYLKPYYSSKQINRYLSLKDYSDYKMIYADRFFREHIQLFPNLKKHLDRFKKVLTSVFAPYGLHRSREESFFNGQGIFLLRKTIRPAFTYVDFPCYVTRAFMILKPIDIDLKYLVGILNSNLIFFWLKSKGKRQGGQLQIDKEPLLDIQVYLTPNDKFKKTLIILVDKIIKLNKEIQEIPENSNKWNLIKSEIEKTDKKIDEEVYKLYDLTPEEIEIVEGIK
jgi:adenine-specific DNA-methyltransferase